MRDKDNNSHLISLSILIACLLNNVWILKGEVTFRCEFIRRKWSEADVDGILSKEVLLIVYIRPKLNLNCNTIEKKSIFSIKIK